MEYHRELSCGLGSQQEQQSSSLAWEKLLFPQLTLRLRPSGQRHPPHLETREERQLLTPAPDLLNPRLWVGPSNLPEAPRWC